ncbi:unnamed protein product [Trifolium pratense]|uniref:Uncharacterized protein n=1 Tax=Trifolium pratense TaxID=57577 RepID=A0ACB0IPK4_TRIPR|nr:unnamed protein product [Trifolium pratense]
MDPSTVQQMSNLQITDTVNESFPAIPVVPYDRMFPFLFPHIDQDKADEIQALFDKYKRDEIPKASFFPLMRDIVGMQLVYSATMQMHEQQKINRQIPVNEQPRTQINSSDLELPFHELYPFLIPHIPDPVKVIELKIIFEKYRRCEIPKDTFVPVMTGILGEQIFKSASAKVKQLKSNLQANEQPGTQINSSNPRITFYQLFNVLAPQIGIEKTTNLYFLGEKCKRGEIPKSDLIPLMKGIVGKPAFKLAVETLLGQVAVNEQPRTQIHSSDLELPFDQLYPFLIPHIPDPDKVIELKVLFDKYRRCEIPKNTFVPVMTGILGEQIFKSASAKVKQLKSNLQVTVNERPRSQINSSKPVVRFNQLFRLLAPQIDLDKTIDLYFLGEKYQRGEIPKCNIIPLMKGIVGEPAFKSAAATLLGQKSSRHVTVNEQPRTQINSGKPVLTFNQMYRLLAPQIGLDKTTDLRFLADKYQRGKIPKSDFILLMKGIVGEPAYRSAVHTLLRQVRTNIGSSGTSL